MTRQKLSAALLAVALAVGGAYYARSRSRAVLPGQPAGPPPDVPTSVVDPDVRNSLTNARDKVLSDPRSGAAWGELGLAFRVHTLNAESNACFAIAAKLDPRNPRWPYLIGLINTQTAPDDATPHLRTAYDLATEPGHKSLTRLRLAEALLDRGDLDEAQRLFAEEAQRDPLSARAQFGLGAVAIARGDDRAAVNSLALVTNSPFARRKATALLAAAHRRLGNTADAERFERDAARVGEDFPWTDAFITEYADREKGRSARMKTAEQLEAIGRFREAAAALDAVARTTPDDQVLVSLGINLARSGQLSDAEQVLRAVVGRSADHASARFYLGYALFTQAEQAVRNGAPDGARPQFEEALTELRRAAELKPDNALARLHAGLSLKYLGRLPEAVDECRAAVRSGPQFADTHAGLAQVLIVMGQSKEAVPHLETAIRLAPDDARFKALLEEAVGKK